MIQPCWANSAVQMMSDCSTSQSGDLACARWMNWLRTSVASAASSNFFTFTPSGPWSALKRLIASVSAPLVSLPAHIVISPLAPLAASSVGAFLASLVAPCSGLEPLPPPPPSSPQPARASIAAVTATTSPRVIA